jgi:hypothetical protein
MWCLCRALLLRHRREQNYILQQLVQIVGKSVGLYNKVRSVHVVTVWSLMLADAVAFVIPSVLSC